MKKLKSLKKGDIILIEWHDSYSVNGWRSLKDVKYLTKKRAICSTIGFFLKTNKHSIIIFRDNSPSEIGELISIPKYTIRSIKTFK